MAPKSVSIKGATHTVVGAIRWALTVRWPLSVKILVGVGILFLLQAFPYSGVFLMLFAAPFWSVPLVNLAVVVAGFEGLLGRAPRWFVLVPVCWFGLYALAVVRDEAALTKAKVIVATANEASQSIVYDPGRHDVVANAFVDKLLLDTRLPVVYSKPRFGRERAIRANRLAFGPLCATFAGRKTGAKIAVRKVHASQARRHGLDQGVPVCIVSFEEQPRRDVIRLHKETSGETVDGLAVTMTVVSAEVEGHRAELRAARAAVLQPVPMLVIGCFLNSGAPSWDCRAQFMRRSAQRFGAKLNNASAFEKVLDLSRIEEAPDYEAYNAEVRTRLAQADLRRDHQRVALLESFLQEPGRFSRRHELLRQFKHAPDRLDPFTGRLIDALDKIDADERQGDKKAYARAAAIGQLLAQVSDAELRRNSRRILALLDGSERGWRRAVGPLVRRTHVFGEAALPLLNRRLERAARRRRLSWPEADAIVSLCRMGLPAAAFVGPKLVEIWRGRTRTQAKTVRSKNGERRTVTRPPRLGRLDRYLYVALLRLGLRDEAGIASGHLAKWWGGVWRTVTPQSPARVCDNVR